jgi:hypothetical protein
MRTKPNDLESAQLGEQEDQIRLNNYILKNYTNSLLRYQKLFFLAPRQVACAPG